MRVPIPAALWMVGLLLAADTVLAAAVTVPNADADFLSVLNLVLLLLLLQGSYVSMGAATTPAHWRNIAILTIIATVAFVGNNTYKSVNTKTSERKRAAALKELEKDE
jgi:membrane-bound ClpP family serine protease